MPSTFSVVGALDAEIKLSLVVVISTTHRKGAMGQWTTSTGTSRGQQARQAHCGAIPERDATVLGAES